MVYVKDPRERVVPSGPWALMPSIITLLPEDVPEIADFISAENAAPIVGLQTIGSLPFLITNISNFVTLNLASKYFHSLYPSSCIDLGMRYMRQGLAFLKYQGILAAALE